MKEVMAIIRMNKINQTKQALADAGITSMHAKECLGRGRGTVEMLSLGGDEKQYEEMANDLGTAGRLIPKRMISIVVPNKLVKTVVDTIIAGNKTGKIGDGKIFVMPVFESVRVRTGETGDDTLDQ
ncbi:MAG: P-II family nitrogen regulator [Spirochaetia bacterium]|jgi:nitrogen regulatory protein PII 2|nr:P-II family nitrogen regulator [Spirochaetia bacterium]